MYDLRRAHFFGNKGGYGTSKRRDGNVGKDTYYSVPMGTEVWEVTRTTTDGMIEEKKVKIADLDENGSEFLMAKGGRGGVGNFKVNQIL